jgi:transcriptional regulator with PAS, ATPase and Fis domain
MRPCKETREDSAFCDVPAGVNEQLVGKSEAFTNIKAVAASVAERRSTVLLLGETGTGKQMLAEYIHRLSDRADEPFVPVDCLSLTESLFESELFGHVKGAFTGAIRDSLGFVRAADKGTLFLDEIGELSIRLQTKLLRLLQEKQVVAVGDVHPQNVDVRVIVATNRNLQEMVEEGAFREDLFFRLSVVTITIPPLRERSEDILLLANYFLGVQAELYGEQKKRLSPEVKTVLCRYGWPGNIRELANVMEHAHILSQGGSIQLDALPPGLQRGHLHCPADDAILTLDEIQTQGIVKALKRTNYCKAAAARLLDVNIQRFNRIIERLHIPFP